MAKGFWFNLTQAEYVAFTGTEEDFKKEPFYLAKYKPNKRRLNFVNMRCK